jgi:hypothetical protein
MSVSLVRILPKLFLRTALHIDNHTVGQFEAVADMGGDESLLFQDTALDKLVHQGLRP